MPPASGSTWPAALSTRTHRPASRPRRHAASCAIIGVEGIHDAADLLADLVVASLDKLRIVVQHSGVRFEFLPE